MRLKMAEKRLCQVQESAQYDSMAPDDGEGQHFQASGHPSAGVNSAGYEDGAEPMDTDEVLYWLSGGSDDRHRSASSLPMP